MRYRSSDCGAPRIGQVQAFRSLATGGLIHFDLRPPCVVAASQSDTAWIPHALASARRRGAAVPGRIRPNAARRTVPGRRVARLGWTR